MRFFSPGRRSSVWMESRARARRRRWPWCARARSRPGTRSKALRRRPARRRSWARPVSRHQDLQAHLARGQRPDTGEHRLYVMDESSLASTKQMHEFVSRLHPNDRVLLVGDTRQHESVEAGRIFAQLQDAGMKTVKLEEIVRQRDPELKQTVEQLARGQVGEAIAGLERQGRIHEVPGHEDRIAAIAKEYAKSPDNTLVVSPDNRSRAEINQAIHAELQAKGVVGREEHRAQVLVPRQDLTGADRMWAARYNPGDVLRYSRELEGDRHRQRRVCAG